MKKVMIIIALMALLAGGAFWFLAGGALNDLIKVKIEQIGTQVTEQSVTVKSVDVKLFKGAGTIKGLVLANPKKYKANSLFSLNEVTLDINLASLTTDIIIIDKIVIDSPQAFVEFTKTGGSNIQDMLAAIDRNIPKSSANNKPTPSTTATVEPIIKVKQFVLAGVALSVDLTELGNKVHKKTLADIKLVNIGGDSGLPASQLGVELLKQSLSSIWKQAQKEQTKIVKDKVENKVKEKLSGFLKKIGG